MTEPPTWWVEGLSAALDALGRPGATLARRFGDQVPTAYVERTAPAAAAADLVELLALEGQDAGGVRIAVQPDPDPGAGMFRIRLYGRRAIELSRVVPVLESFGLTVVEAVPHHIVVPGARIGAPDGQRMWHLDDFGLRDRSRSGFDPAADGPRLVAAVQAVWQGDAEVDSLNRLVTCARLDWHDVVVLRAYRRYRRQVGTPWSDRQLDDPLVAFPEVAVALLAYFAARFGEGGGAEEARAAVLDGLAAVERLEQDQVLRANLALMDATVRTSHYARRPDGSRLPTLALKLESALVPELPPPRPAVEAFVYSPRVEGLHLRGGAIARGGIRWSDRQDDLRTEVLGLVRAQVLKNAGIVPTGAKGGYVCKRLAGGEGVDGRGVDGRGVDIDVATEVRECYRLFVSGLLDLTDNVVAGQVVPPPGVACRDGEDSYLVVAADRGTATFSDLANQISAEHGFWLGDAFASGGEHGYDHKAMGITARGAWVAARQHFRQLGIDPEREEIRVIGVGDMSGDVFGNGMLQSRTIRLLAAFDHRHIFVDPDPDPARSFAAREALFARPRSSWQDYDPGARSSGGGVWSRTAKMIALAPEAAAVVGLAAGPVSPPQLVSAILTAPADLLWLGGIGTFVKAPGESQTDAGDQADDAVRVDADRVRARVVAEGGNLGFTQRARIVYSRRGGKINTDFIDNAAGVATSDYEVNLKILLALAVDAGRISGDERHVVLAALQDDVARAVLADVGLTARAVTRAVPASAADLDAYEALLADLERAGRLDRKVEALPEPEDLAVRRAAGAGLTRPEAAVILSMAKSELAHALEASPLVADPVVHDAVTAYFPEPVVARFGDLIRAHRLYPQLAATRMAHEIIDRMGVTWAHETADEFGAGLADVGRTYWAARRVLGAAGRWQAVDEMAATVDVDAEDVLQLSVAEALHTLARRYLARGSKAIPIEGDRQIAMRLEAVDDPLAAGPDRVKSLVDLGVGVAQAQAFARLAPLARCADLGVVTRALGLPADAAPGLLAAMAAFDTALGVGGFRAALGRLAVTSRWGRWQVRRLEDDVADLRCQAVVAALGGTPVPGIGCDPAAVMGGWLAGRAPAAARFQRLAGQLRDPDADGSALAALAVRALTDLVRTPS